MIFEQAINALIELGFYKFLLPFILIAAIIFALLRKTQVFGESPLIGGIISISIAFFIFGLPVLSGANIVKPLTSFFGQISVIILIIAFGLLISGLFVPNLMGKMGEWMTGGGFVWWMIVIVVIIALTSGLFFFVISPIGEAVGGAGKVVLVIFLLILFMIMAALIGGGKA
jgi:hypothetical protein